MSIKVKGKLTPLRDKVLISDMEFGDETTNRGIIIPSGNGKLSGIHPRWGKVFAIGPLQKDVKIGDWILLEHGRWSRGTKYEMDDGSIIDIRLADNAAIMMVADKKPEDVYRSV
jgi:co-chaperonin GroES (HSP10)